MWYDKLTLTRLSPSGRHLCTDVQRVLCRLNASSTFIQVERNHPSPPMTDTSLSTVGLLTSARALARSSPLRHRMNVISALGSESELGLHLN